MQNEKCERCGEYKDDVCSVDEHPLLLDGYYCEDCIIGVYDE